MPGMLITSTILLTIAVIGVLVARGSKGEDGKIGGGLTAFVAGLFAFIFFVWSCLTIVSTRNVGIVTSFGRPVGVLDNGLHLKWPWQHVPELNGTIQTDNQIGGFENGKCSGGTPIRLANNSTACADNTIRWRIAPNSGDTLFRDYQNDSNIRDSLVTRELNATLNVVFSTYNPLAPDATGGPNLADLSDKATKTLQAKIGNQIEIQNVIISIVHFDDQTQSKVNAYQSQVADTRIAEAKQQTATAEAAANRILADSVSHDPNVLVSKCLDMLGQGKPFPVGFSCWPGAGMPVTIPAR